MWRITFNFSIYMYECTHHSTFNNVSCNKTIQWHCLSGAPTVGRQHRRYQSGLQSIEQVRIVIKIMTRVIRSWWQHQRLSALAGQCPFNGLPLSGKRIMNITLQMDLWVSGPSWKSLKGAHQLLGRNKQVLLYHVLRNRKKCIYKAENKHLSPKSLQSQWRLVC